MRLALPRAVRRATRIVTPSQAVKRSLLRHGWADAARIDVYPWYFIEVTTTTNSFPNAMQTLNVEVPDLPDFTGIQRRIYITLDAEETNSAGTIRLRDTVSGDTGPEVTVDQAAYDAETVQLDVPASWAGTTRAIIVDGKASASQTLRLKSVNRVGVRVLY